MGLAACPRRQRTKPEESIGTTRTGVPIWQQTLQGNCNSTLPCFSPLRVFHPSYLLLFANTQPRTPKQCDDKRRILQRSQSTH